MNIAEVVIPRSYNFYHDSFPEEARIVYEPMQNMMIRLRDIVIRDDYQSPLLNESMFLANYIITCFNSEGTPLMKLLTSMLTHLSSPHGQETCSITLVMHQNLGSWCAEQGNWSTAGPCDA